MIRLRTSRAASLVYIVLLFHASTSLAQNETAPKKGDLPEFMRPADAKKAAASIKSLADKMMPSADEMKANGQWKLPWEFPAGMKVILPERVEHRHRASLYRVPQDRYWERRAPEAGFVGISPEQAEKRGEDLAKQVKAEAAGLTDRQIYIGAMVFTSIFHPATPTLATVQGAYADYTIQLARSSGDPEKLLDILAFGDQIQVRAMMLDNIYAGVPDDKLKEYAIDTFSLSQQWTRFALCRATEWDGLVRIGDAQKEIEDIVRKNQPEWENAEGPISQVIVSPKTVQDPGWGPANKRLNEALGDSGSVDEYIKKHNIGFSTAVVNVRKLNKDAIAGDAKERQIKDLTDEDAKRLEDKMNAAYKAVVELQTPKTEKELENLRKTVASARSSTEAEETRKKLDKKAQAWKEFQAQRYKVQRRPDVGVDDCYVITVKQISAEQDQAILHTASLRYGVYLAEVDIMSFMPEDEASKDLEFFLKLLEQRMTAGQNR